jgi:hypothetical protein
MKAWPVSARVNNPKNDDAEVIVPIELKSLARQEDSPQPQLLWCPAQNGTKAAVIFFVLLAT